MNGVSILSRIVTKIFQWLFYKFGINIILLIALVIEIPCMFLFYKEKSFETQIYTNYGFETVGEPELIHASDIQPGAQYSNDDCYKITLHVDNLYQKTSNSYPSFYSADGDNIYCTLEPFNYYSDIDSYDILGAKACAPAGARSTFSYYVASSWVEGKTLSFVSYENYYDISLPSHKAATNNTLTITFP